MRTTLTSSTDCIQSRSTIMYIISVHIHTGVWATPEFARLRPPYSVALRRARTGRMIRDGYSRIHRRPSAPPFIAEKPGRVGRAGRSSSRRRRNSVIPELDGRQGRGEDARQLAQVALRLAALAVEFQQVLAGDLPGRHRGQEPEALRDELAGPLGDDLHDPAGAGPRPGLVGRLADPPRPGWGRDCSESTAPTRCAN